MARAPHPPTPSPSTARGSNRPAAAPEVVLVPDGGTLTLEEAFPRHELARVMPRVREIVGQATGTEAGATGCKDAGAGI